MSGEDVSGVRPLATAKAANRARPLATCPGSDPWSWPEGRRVATDAVIARAAVLVPQIAPVGPTFAVSGDRPLVMARRVTVAGCEP